VLVVTGERGWLVRPTPDGVDVTGAEPDQAAAASGSILTGDPQSVLLWRWRRGGDDLVQIGGDRAPVAKLRELLGNATR
jgi:hypothetical protein